MINTQVKTNTDLSKLFVFEDTQAGEHLAYMEEIGTIIFQSALMQYLSNLDEHEAKIFETFIMLNIDKENFIELLCKEYSNFEEVLVEEITSLKSEINF